MAKKHTGRCACSSAAVHFDTDPNFIAPCHCLDCKKASDIAPKLEMFTKRRLPWMTPLNLPQFTDMPQ